MFRCMLLTLATTALSASCRGPADQTSTSTSASTSPLVTAVQVVQEWRDDQSGVRESEELVIRNESDWRDLWDRVHRSVEPPPTMPTVDFEQHMVVAVFLGEKEQGGYGVEISRLTPKAGGLQAQIEETAPEPDMMTIQALTQPYHMVVISKVEGTVDFVSR